MSADPLLLSEALLNALRTMAQDRAADLSNRFDIDPQLFEQVKTEPYEATIAVANRILTKNRWILSLESFSNFSIIAIIGVASAIIFIGYSLLIQQGLLAPVSTEYLLIIAGTFAALAYVYYWYVADAAKSLTTVGDIVKWCQAAQFDEDALDLLEQRASILSGNFSLRSLLPLVLLPIVLSLLPWEQLMQNLIVIVFGILFMVVLGIGLMYTINQTYVADLIRHGISQYRFVLRKIAKEPKYALPAPSINDDVK
jgi:hypothetical protein